ncbi:UbiA family prenyltransferase, partial [bacterium]|nr:UbiA family prenyltransferase [bacterium]
MKILKGLIQLARPTNTLICGLSVVCGSILGGAPLDRIRDFISFFYYQTNSNLQSWELRTLSGAVSASLILAAGNAFNDVRDLQSDRINTPHRPIPSGLITSFGATIF